MATALQLCYASSSVAAEIAALDAQVDTIAAPVRAAIDALLTDSAQEAADALTEAVANHDTAFTGTSAQTLNGALTNAGLPSNNRTRNEALKQFADAGFLSAAGNLYQCNTATTTPSQSKNVEVQDPDDHSYLLQVLQDPSYTDPVITTPLATASTTTLSATSCTGAYLSPGMLAQMRELYKGFGGDLVQLRAFMESLNSGSGVGVVWSLLTYFVAYSTDDSQLTLDDVRDQAQFPLYDEDINLLGTKALAAIEYPVGTQISKSVAQAQAKILCKTLSLPTDPVLMCRFVRLDTNTTVRAQSPVLVTAGFDGALFSPTSYRLGISVCGYARIIDVTGDKGTYSLYSTYTSSSVATAIQNVFGDLLSVTGTGGEITFAVNQRGSGASLAFFHVDDYDASEACGIGGLVRAAAATSGQSTTGLVDLLGIKWSGGEPVKDSLTAAAMGAVKTYELDTSTVTCITTGSDYWTTRATEADAIVDSLVSESTNATDPNQVLSDVAANTKLYAALASFVDIVSLNYQDVTLVLDEFGSDLAHILIYQPTVYSVDLYRTPSTVLDAFSKVAQQHIDNDGVEKAQNSYNVITPFRKNRAKLSYYYTLYRYLQVESTNLDSTEQVQLTQALARYVPSLYWDNTITLEKSSPDTTLTGSDSSSVSSLWSDVFDFTSSMLSTSSIDLGSTLSAVVKAACKLDPDVCSAMESFFSSMAAAEMTAEEKISAFFDLMSSPASASIRAMVLAVALLNRLVDRATALVLEAKQKMTSFYQRATGSKKSLPEAMNALANLNLNVYDNFGFKTKFLSCYVSGSGGALLAVAWQKALEILNQYISAINDLINALTKAIQKALDLLICLANKISDGFTGSLTYERKGASVYKAAGVVPIPVSYTMTCTMTFGDSGMDPALARELTKLKQKLTALLDLLHLQTITFNQLGKTVNTFKGLEITKASAAGLLIEQLREEILKKLQDALSC